MQKVKMNTVNKSKENVQGRVKQFFIFKGSPMVRIEGNYYTGGFNISKNKVRDILNNVEILKEFVSGDLDDRMKELEEGEALEV